jgi:hypothetical protein
VCSADVYVVLSVPLGLNLLDEYNAINSAANAVKHWHYENTCSALIERISLANIPVPVTQDSARRNPHKTLVVAAGARGHGIQQTTVLQAIQGTLRDQQDTTSG